MGGYSHGVTGRANRRGRVSPFTADDVARFWKWRIDENLSYREIAERQGAKFHQIYYIMQGKSPAPANGNGASNSHPGEGVTGHVHSTSPATPSATAEEKE
jgi:hypothetical protein